MNGDVVQRIHDDVVIDFNIVEKEAIDFKDIANDYINQFDINKIPLFRVTLIKTAENLHVIVFDIHHIIADGLSSNIIIKEIIKLYNNEELSYMPLQYKDYSEWYNNVLLKSENILKMENYWLNVHQNLNEIARIPTDFQRPSKQNFEGNTLYFDLNKDLVKRLQELSVQTSTTLYLILFTAYNILLHKYSNRCNIIVGVAVSNRRNIQLRNTVGMFVNTIAVINTVEHNVSFYDCLMNVAKNMMEAYENQEYPLDLLIKKLGFKSDRSHNPLFDTMFIMQESEIKSKHLKDIHVKGIKTCQRSSKFDFMLNCYFEDEILNFEASYCTSLYREKTIEILWQNYVCILENISSDIFIKIEDISLDNNQLIYEYQEIPIEFTF